MCSCCLLTDRHWWNKCNYKKQCQVNACKSYHHPLLHIPSKEPLKNVENDFQPKRQNVDQPPADSVDPNEGDRLFNMIPVHVNAQDGTVRRVLALLDSGSNVTLVDQSLYDQLGLSGSPCDLKLNWTQGIKAQPQESFTVELQLKGIKEEEWHTLSRVQTIKNLNLPRQSLDARSLQNRFEHLKQLPIIGYGKMQPMILIGLSHAKLCLGKEVRMK